MDKNEVNIAFEILLEEIEEVFNILTKEGEKAFKEKDFEKATELSKNGENLKNFRQKVKTLQEEWQNIFANKMVRDAQRIKVRRKLKKGLKTPEDKYYIPILESLVELGGKGELSEVFEKVYKRVKNILNEYDMQTLTSDPKKKRWENTVQWARYTMVTKGLLSDKSSWGVWEITKAGKDFLNSQQQ
ncbi:MAG TPA: winged helix-turn-helix domain-containing protein [Candidatus Hydrogenedens sp.]|nr:winged helix-turn-helix domain-containing protein [Candidatus Hydrogenedens sp.]